MTLVGANSWARIGSSSARGSTDRASDYGSEGWGFESLRAREPAKNFTTWRVTSFSHFGEWLVDLWN